MNYYLIFLRFFGPNFFGWQIQSQGERTVQGELEKALRTISNSNDIRCLASGRTDAGVHALNLPVKITIPLKIDLEALKKALNSVLPFDIRVERVEESSQEFHPIRDSVSKEYMYLFTNEDYGNPLLGNHVANISYQLDFEMMKKACLLFIGEHDFCNFYCQGSDINSTTRIIHHCDIESFQKENEFGVKVYKFHVHGNGFLKQMVRLMMGTIWWIGRGKVDLESLRGALRQKIDQKLGPVAPAQGLYMLKAHINTGIR